MYYDYDENLKDTLVKKVGKDQNPKDKGEEEKQREEERMQMQDIKQRKRVSKQEGAKKIRDSVLVTIKGRRYAFVNEKSIQKQYGKYPIHYIDRNYNISFNKLLEENTLIKYDNQNYMNISANLNCLKNLQDQDFENGEEIWDKIVEQVEMLKSDKKLLKDSEYLQVMFDIKDYVDILKDGIREYRETQESYMENSKQEGFQEKKSINIHLYMNICFGINRDNKFKIVIKIGKSKHANYIRQDWYNHFEKLIYQQQIAYLRIKLSVKELMQGLYNMKLSDEDIVDNYNEQRYQTEKKGDGKWTGNQQKAYIQERKEDLLRELKTEEQIAERILEMEKDFSPTQEKEIKEKIKKQRKQRREGGEEQQEEENEQVVVRKNKTAKQQQIKNNYDMETPIPSLFIGEKWKKVHEAVETKFERYLKERVQEIIQDENSKIQKKEKKTQRFYYSQKKDEENEDKSNIEYYEVNYIQIVERIRKEFINSGENILKQKINQDIIYKLVMHSQIKQKSIEHQKTIKSLNTQNKQQENIIQNLATKNKQQEDALNNVSNEMKDLKNIVLQMQQQQQQQQQQHDTQLQAAIQRGREQAYQRIKEEARKKEGQESLQRKLRYEKAIEIVIEKVKEYKKSNQTNERKKKIKEEVENYLQKFSQIEKKEIQEKILQKIGVGKQELKQVIRRWLK